MEDSNMDGFIKGFAITGRKLMVLQKQLSDVAWEIDQLVVSYAQFRQQEDRAKAEPKTKEKTPEATKIAPKTSKTPKIEARARTPVTGATK